MRKRLLSLVIVCGLLFSVTACGNYDIADENSANPSNPSGAEENPFTQSEEDVGLGTLEHGETNPRKAEDQGVLPYEYNGGEFTLEYHFMTEGKLDNIGFLLFLDGKPQAYKINDTSAEYEYLHSFKTSDKHEENFSFVFTPNTGKKGDTLNITIISITNPSFQPDMKETSSYGWYHQPLERVLELHFNQDADNKGVSYGETENIFSNVNAAEEKVTSSFIENDLAENGWGDVTMDTLNNSIYTTISYDGKLIYDNINLADKKTLTVRFTLSGMAGKRYGISFFLNHKPISLDDVLSYDVTLTKGNVWVIEATIDTSALNEFNTFYAIAVAADHDDDSVPAIKTGSILLYKED